MNEAQKEEMMALEAILPTESFRLDDNGFEGEISIELDLPPGGLRVSTDDGACSSLLVVTDQRSLGSLLSLRFSLPEDYPEKSPPKVEILCDWLQPALKELLLKRLTEESPHEEDQVVLFDWCQALKERALEFLGAEQELTVSAEAFVKMAGASPTECGICFVETKSSELQRVGDDCQHRFCQECLTSHCETQIREGNAATSKAVGCPEPGCKAAVDGGVVRSSVTDPELFAMYDAAALNRAVRSMSVETAWCPRRDCQYPAEVSADGTCGQCPACRLTFCVSCRRTYHGPGDCEERVAGKSYVQLRREAEEEYRRNFEERYSLPTRDDVGPDCFEVMRLSQRQGAKEARKHVVRVITDMVSGLTPEGRLQLVKTYLQGSDEEKKEIESEYGKAYIAFYASGMSSLTAYSNFLKNLEEESRNFKRNVHIMNSLTLMDSYVGTIKPCPKCFIPIEKDGGCSIMWCTMCETQFCWECTHFSAKCICGHASRYL